VLKDFAGPVATIIAAGTALFVSYRIGRRQVDIAQRNWETSADKLRLDLFDKRMAVIDDLDTLIGEFQLSEDSNIKKVVELNRLSAKIDRLFGSEVSDYVKELQKQFYEHHNLSGKIKRAQNKNDDVAIDEMLPQQIDLVTNIEKYFDVFPGLVRDYVKMHQKSAS
jgi:hypothetical protein